MAVVCPVCGMATQNEHFCEHCHVEVAHAVPLRAPDCCPLPDGSPIPLAPDQVATLSIPGSAVTIAHEKTYWRVYWLSPLAWQVWQPLVQHRQSCVCSVLPPCQVIPKPEGVWVLAQATGQRPQPWLEVAADPLGDLTRLVDFLGRLAVSLEGLHSVGLLWLTFNPLELEEWYDQGQPLLRFTNLDLRVFPTGRSPAHLQVSPSYAAPEIWAFQAERMLPPVDVYHLALFSYYWLAGLLPGGFAGQGLQAFDFNLPPLRIYQPQLPPGIAPVLAQGHAVDPDQRFPTPSDLVKALSAAVDRACQRQRTSQPVCWDIGCTTRTGRAKEALQRVNEDHALVKHFRRGLPEDSPARTLAVVCDGISTCDVGTGALASRLTCLVLDNNLGGDITTKSFPEVIRQACRRANEALLNWAVEQGYGEALRAGKALMGTTLTAAWLEDHHLTLANLGDSRAYLVLPDCIDQLTVDTDIRCTLLALRVPPDEVNQLGYMARALRDCIGGCAKEIDGKLVVPEDHGVPAVTSWRMLPGDVVVLCSDGLVEEGLFLEAEDVAKLIRCHAGLPAQKLAEFLADAADARHRLPSLWEPEGHGDNITVVVIKVRALES